MDDTEKVELLNAIVAGAYECTIGKNDKDNQFWEAVAMTMWTVLEFDGGADHE